MKRFSLALAACLLPLLGFAQTPEADVFRMPYDSVAVSRSEIDIRHANRLWRRALQVTGSPRRWQPPPILSHNQIARNGEGVRIHAVWVLPDRPHLERNRDIVTRDVIDLYLLLPEELDLLDPVLTQAYLEAIAWSRDLSDDETLHLEDPEYWVLAVFHDLYPAHCTGPDDHTRPPTPPRFDPERMS